ncbi:hypothetical protein MtrunA17_Chr7g0240911 [Medicago truncatula]|uniref:Uncharacterized protein n=1 Tax=Medicago truncatula TaxID=3880 RepID=A0A396H0S4_MEDTR|nr:hypothetical protein MtrunA17_Chr7g0240911 [Medicago truncatula]
MRCFLTLTDGVTARHHHHHHHQQLNLQTLRLRGFLELTTTISRMILIQILYDTVILDLSSYYCFLETLYS